MTEYTVRRATPDDAATIARQRSRMFIAAGYADEARGGEVEEAFAPWVRPLLENGTYIGWMVHPLGEPEHVVAGAGLWVMEFPPHFLDLTPRRAYLLNFYVEPEARGQKLAERLLALAVEEAGRLGIRVVSLHASWMGKPIYEKNGFEASTEMLRILPEAPGVS
ncbi:MAG TPA: GNAT family N-acetyltransferase [Granulicella sp.]